MKSFVVLVIMALAWRAVATPSRFDAFPRAFREVLPGDGDVVYVMAPDRVLESIRLESGTVTWRAPRAARPLVRVGGRLLAQSEPLHDGELALVVLDVETGEVQRSVRIDLPESVAAPIDDRLGESFEVLASTDGADVLVRWRATRRQISGRHASGGSSLATREGACRLDVATGRTTSVEVPAATPSTGTVPGKADANAPASAWRVGGFVAATARDSTSCLVLRRWDASTGERRADVSLTCEPFVAVAVAADGRHVLVSRRLGSAEPGAGYAWTIYAVDTGARIGSATGETSAEAFVVRDGSMLYEASRAGRLVKGLWTESPLSLRLVDLRTGTARWSHPVRDTRYHGPYPQS